MDLRRVSPRTVAAAILAAGCAGSLALNLPGHMSYDSILQLWQARVGVYNMWHPPVMAWMLGLGDAVLPGTGLFAAFDILLLYGALASLLFLPGRPSWWAPAVALGWVLSPPGLIYPGIVWKDVLFAAALLGGFAALAHAAARWEDVRARAALIVTACMLLVLAMLARQNGFVAPVAGAAALAWIAGSCARRRRWLSALGYGGGALGACLLTASVATAALDERGDGEPARLYQLEDMQVYDLAAALKVDPGLRLDRIGAANPALETLIRTQGVRAYSPIRIDPLNARQDIQAALSDTPPEAVAAQWRDLVLRHPWLYMKVRMTAFAWVFATPDLPKCLPVFVGVSGPKPWMSALGLKERWNARDDFLAAYTARLEGTPPLWHPAYAVLALAALIVFLRRRAPADLALAGLIAASGAFTASFFVISIACDYRYLYALDVSAVAAALYLAATAGRPAQKATGAPIQ